MNNNYNELIIFKDNKIILKNKNKIKQPKKFNSDYNSSSYTPYNKTRHTIQSITKSIVSLLFGIAIQNNHFDIDIINEYIYKYFDNYTLSKKIKVKHLLTMTSGIKWNTNYDDPNNTTFGMEKNLDWINFIMNCKMKDEPGKKFHYKDGDTVLLGYIFEKLTNMNLEEYAKKYLYKLLKINGYWNKTPNKKPDPEGGLYMSSKSLLEIGKLILKNGKYKDKQIISKDYFKLMISNQMPKNTKSFFNYGYQWWLHNDIIFGWGYKGQFLVINQKTNTIGILYQWNNKKEIQPFTFINFMNELK
jgi:CubicO group peptidase (beta-lactamase class C family)